MTSRHRWPILSSRLLVLFVLFVTSGSSVSGQVYVFGRTDYFIGLRPASVVTADVNYDGRLDLIVTNGGSDSVAIFLGNPDGTFAAPRSYPTGSQPYSVTVGDFNDDGKPDLAVANYASNTVSVFLGIGDGTFEARVDYPVGRGPAALAVGDLNGDGILDLVIGNSQESTVSVLLGNGDGTFAGATTYATRANSFGVVMGDFNGDGKLDLAVSVFYDVSKISILLGNGDGTFQGHVDYDAPNGPTALITADFNNDGNLDLAVTGGGGISILLGNGDGTFQTRVHYLTGLFPRSVVAGDFNSDGELDLAVANNGSANFPPQSPVSILLGNGDGTFQPHVDYPVGLNPISIATGDFNGDGQLDLVVANFGSPSIAGNSVSILIGNGDGTFPSIHTDYPAGVQPISLVATDFDNDGNIDLAVINSNTGQGTVSILLGNGEGTFQAAKSSAAGQNPSSLAVGDFNGDGVMDLAVANNSTSPSTSVLIGNGDGTFQPPNATALEPGFASLTAGDFNGDGKLDLAVTHGESNNVSILLGNGNGTFQAPVDYAAGNYTVSPITADLNGDGRLDLVVVNSSSDSISVLIGNGDGTFRPHVDYSVGRFPSFVLAADLNADGKPDLVVLDSLNRVQVLLGNGDGTFRAPVSYLTLIAPESVVAGDFNGDGKVDLAVSGGHSSSGSLFSILLGNGDGTFRPHVDYALAANSGPYSLAAEDFNDDSATDLAVADMANNVISIYLNRPTLALFPSSLDFGSQPVGSTSPAQVVELSNPGSMPLSITGIATSGDFAQSNDCSLSVAVGSNCMMSVTFTPAATGPRPGTLTVNDNAYTSPQTIGLEGVGIVAASQKPRSRRRMR